MNSPPPWTPIDHPAFDYYRRLGLVREAVLRDLQRHWDLPTAAAVAGLQPKYFWTLFYEKIGIRFREWVHVARICEACRLLRKNNHSIEAVLTAVGYRNRRTFTRNFKLLVGVAPSVFRRTAAPRPRIEPVLNGS